jgi:signal transduction histidine kinase
MTVANLRFATEMLKRLGEELIPSPDAGIIELVRNAYDADAIKCRVELRGVDKPGGQIRIIDDGNGMDLNSIINGWLVVGRSAKIGGELTSRLRRPIGEKGLGRLAGLRLGSLAKLTTRPITEPEFEYELEIPWQAFDSATVIEEVAFEVKRTSRKPPYKKHGTTIEVIDLRKSMTRHDVTRLSRSLLLLSDPFEHSAAFRATLAAPAFRDLERRVRTGYLADADFHMRAELNSDGCASARVTDHTGHELFRADHATLRGGKTKTRAKLQEHNKRPYNAPRAVFELWAFLLSETNLAPRNIVKAELSAWLQEVGGVHVYHRGLRVHPYGDPGFDWLDMNLSRTSSPEERPSTRTSVGRIVISDTSDQLRQKTDRSGFIEDEAFLELKQFAKDALDWMGRKRLERAELRREKAKRELPERISTARAAIREALVELPADSRASMEAALQQMDSARNDESRLIRDELRLYRTLATVGTTFAVFGHEAAKPAGEIIKNADAIRRRGRSLLGAVYDERLASSVDRISRHAAAIDALTRLPLRLVARRKRKLELLDVNAIATDVVLLFKSFLDEAGIVPTVTPEEGQPRVRAAVADIEAIVTNLLINAVNAFKQAGASGQSSERLVRFETPVNGDFVGIVCSDSGPGIDESQISINEIWLPGRTSFKDGTGLGLTIVRDVVSDLGGRWFAAPHGPLGGAEFRIDLPMAEE